ncbi:MAG: hypothetical protein JWM11_4146 [Planctomycetaceae bacterium]|nr:hypothetical protein [Planctomycetaceae bacterium]
MNRKVVQDDLFSDQDRATSQKEVDRVTEICKAGYFRCKVGNRCDAEHGTERDVLIARISTEYASWVAANNSNGTDSISRKITPLR